MTAIVLWEWFSTNPAMWFTFAIIATMIVAYAVETFPIEAVSIATITALLVLFTLVPGREGPEPAELVAGFANPALITVLALLVVGQALFNTDALDQVSRWMAKAGGASRTRNLAVILICAAIFSALLNNTPIVVMFIPILTTIARQRNFDPSKGLLPLSYAAILGGMTTMIGSSTNLLVAGLARESGINIGFFDFTALGIVLAGTGWLYVVFVLPFLLKPRSGMAEQLNPASGRQFITQIDIGPGHRLEGIQSRGGLFKELTDMTVRMVLRGEKTILPPFEEVRLRAGDSVIVAATRTALTKALAAGSAGVIAEETEAPADADGTLEANFTLAEAVVPPGSRYVARTIRGSGLRGHEGVAVLGVQRRSRMQRATLDTIRMEPGDTILVGGAPDDVARLRASRDLLLLEWSAAIVPMRRYAPRAIAIFAIMLVCVVANLVPIMVATVAAAFAMLISRCITVLQARRAFDSRIFMMVGAAIACAVAMEATGGAQFLAQVMIDAMQGQPPAAVLSAFFLLLAALTNILSNNATAVLFTPVAINLAAALGVDPMAFVIAVIFAANCSFATPVGYQTNLLVMAPGHYKFADFLIAGVPLVILVWLTYSFVAPWYYGL